MYKYKYFTKSLNISLSCYVFILQLLFLHSLEDSHLTLLHWAGGLPVSWTQQPSRGKGRGKSSPNMDSSVFSAALRVPPPVVPLKTGLKEWVLVHRCQCSGHRASRLPENKPLK